MEPPLSRRERKKQETCLRLMQAALRLFREQGYEVTTVEQIAEAADVAKGTFFNYFDTKEAILPALVEWRLETLREALAPGSGAPASPIARIKLALRLVAEDPLVDHTLAQQVFASLAQRRQLPAGHPGYPLIDLLVELVRHAQAAGEIRTDLDALDVACAIRSLFFQQVMMWHHGHCSGTLPQILEAMLDLLLEGIAGPHWKGKDRSPA